MRLSKNEKTGAHLLQNTTYMYITRIRTNVRIYTTDTIM